MTAALRLVSLVLLRLIVSVIAAARPCPVPIPGLKSERVKDAEDVELTLRTRIPRDLDVVWVNNAGKEVVVDDFGATEDEEEEHRMKTHPGDVFRVYAMADGEGESGERVLLRELVMREEPRRQRVDIFGCGDIEDGFRPSRNFSFERAEEFEALAHEGPDESGAFPACGPEGESHRWSCVRWWPAEACDARHRNDPQFAGKDKFGFQNDEEEWSAGTFEDRDEDVQMKILPRLTKGPGFLKMTMPERLRGRLLPWFADRVEKGMIAKERGKQGGALNQRAVSNGKVSLDKDKEMMRLVYTEVQDAVEWWTNWTELVHTATYGARVYGRGAVLLNHLDRPETHLASAILQVDQSVDPDGGWPVEIIADDRSCYEIFLQPGEMLLYEGARFPHGRPMNFRGESYANVFTHFSPPHWSGNDPIFAKIMRDEL